MKLPITVLIAAKNEEANLLRCLSALGPAARVIVLDSQSTDRTPEIAAAHGAEIVQFVYGGTYPKKRQWALDNIDIATEWVFLLDADEVAGVELWKEIAAKIAQPRCRNAFLITKGFHFLGRRMRFGGFSHEAVLLFRKGKARFEKISAPSAQDMEVHERLLVNGRIGRLKTPLVHQDFKGLHAYIDRHNHYSTWEAQVRHRYLHCGSYGEQTVAPLLFGNTQERRRFLKKVAIRMPFESILWFLYHYVFRLGFLEGRAGLIASHLRANYIAQARAKLYELQLENSDGGASVPASRATVPSAQAA